jgi:hypothetical protein
MTQLILKSDINPFQLDALLKFFHAWNIEAETLPAATHVKAEEKVAADAGDPFSELRGMWKDRDIDAKELRRQAWGKRFPR